MKKLLLLPLFVLLSTPITSHAQDNSSGAAIKNTIGIGPRLGYYKANDAENGSFYGGLQTRIRVGPVLGFEGSIEYRGGQEYNFAGQKMKTKFVPITASALIFIPVSNHFAPYGIAGLGAYYTIHDYEGTFSNKTNDSFNFGYHLGFGLELPINSHSALNFDYRYLFLNPNENQTNTANADYSGNVFTAGLMFYL